jgi:hypothetical protein
VESGEGELRPLFLIFILLFVVTSRGFGLGGSILHPLPRRHSSGTPGPSALPPYMHPIAMDTVGLPPHRILRQGDPPWGAVCVPNIMHNEQMCMF